MRFIAFILLNCLLLSCNERSGEKTNSKDTGVFLIILGNVQDGGSPHIGCKKKCCLPLFKKPDPERLVVSLGLADVSNKKAWLFDASPDMSHQLSDLMKHCNSESLSGLQGVFLTHAHIGHYSGLMYFGKEALGGKNIPVYAMPRMKKFLSENGPWSQLVSTNNIELRDLKDSAKAVLSDYITVTPIRVPHRDEFSETVGFVIEGPNKKALYIPDIDKWSKWNRDIKEEIQKVDYAFIDGTFFSAAEVNNRDISEIPHPFVSESIQLFSSLPESERKKIFFIHFNHSNPLLDPTSAASKEVKRAGMGVARKGMKFGL